MPKSAKMFSTSISPILAINTFIIEKNFITIIIEERRFIDIQSLLIGQKDKNMI